VERGVVKRGIFGGTFDPPHYGHLIAAEIVLERQKLDRILFVPNSTPPNKNAEEVSAPEDRLAMVHAAVMDSEYFDVSDLEVKRGGISYTVDTLRQLKEGYPGDELHFLIGADILKEFETWKDPKEILSMIRVVAMTRPGKENVPRDLQIPKGIALCEIPLIDISSTDIRSRVREGLPITFMVPAGVERYIKEKGLYRRSG
jgi:nicotinate-nucleotide adenylyltransferase